MVLSSIWKKRSALVLVAVLLGSSLAGLLGISIISADETVILNSVTWTAAWSDQNMIDDLALDPEDEPLIINEIGDGSADVLIYLGEEEVPVGFWIQPNVVNAGPNHTFTVSITPAPGNTLIDVSTNDPGEDLDTPPYSNSTWYSVDGLISVGNTGDVEKAYEMRCTIRDDTGTPVSQTFTFWIYVSSVWHDATTPDEPHEMTYPDFFVSDVNDDPEFEAGDYFEEGALSLEEDAPFDPLDPILTLIAPADDNTADGMADITLASATGMSESSVVVQLFGYESGTVDFPVRVNVQPRTPPGITLGTAQFEFIRDDHGYDQVIIENARPVDFAVDFSFADHDPWSEPWSGYDNSRMSPYQVRVVNVIIIQDSPEE